VSDIKGAVGPGPADGTVESVKQQPPACSVAA